VGVPVVGDAAALRVDPVASFAVPLSCHAFELREERGLELGVGKAVGPPHDHGRGADHALGHPARLVLEEPWGDALCGAEQTALQCLRHREACCVSST
jgi:hypothetical protein